MKRSKVAALLGAGLLTFGVASIALADTLNSSFVGKSASQLTQGTAADCAKQFPDLADGQVGWFFVLGGANESDGSIDAAFSNPTTADAHLDNATFTNGNALRWSVVVDGDGSTVLDSASTDATSNAAGDNHLVVSHVCVGGPGGGGGGESDVPTQPSTDSAIGSTGQSGPSETAWLLVVGLGVLLGSIVVLTPARAKGKR